MTGDVTRGNLERMFKAIGLPIFLFNNPISSVPYSLPSSAISSAQVNVTSSTALVAVTGLALPLAAGGTYSIEAYLPGTAGASGGAKFSLDTSDTLTATSVDYSLELNTASTTALTHTTTFGAGLGSTAAVILSYISGTIVVNAAGTLIVKFAQNASNATASSVYINSWLRATRLA